MISKLLSMGFGEFAILYFSWFCVSLFRLDLVRCPYHYQFDRYAARESCLSALSQCLPSAPSFIHPH